MSGLIFKRTGKVLLIYTGGTIGMGRNPRTGALEPLDFKLLLERIPEMNLLPATVDTYQFNPIIDSSDMNPRLWAQLVRIISRQYDDYDGFVVLHGTDTMAYTASALSFMFENLTKPVILTGSQLPIGELRTDGKENLLSSLELAIAHNEDGTPRVPEVCIFFNGKLLRGNRSTKGNADGFNAFETFNYPHLCDAGVNFVFHDHHILKPDFSRPMISHTALDPNVFVFSLFPGIQESVFRYFADSHDIRGIVIRSYGSGNAPQLPWLLRFVKEASYRGTIVVNISQCICGSVEMGRYDTGYQLQEAGVVSGHDATVEATVTKLMFLQAQYKDPHIIRNYLSRSIAGEITI